MDIILHIGLHKTGTTFLQRCFFPELELDFHRSVNAFDHQRSTRLKYRKLLISDENLSGRPWIRPKFRSDLEGGGRWIENFEACVLNLKDVFPNAKIILGVREHMSLLTSLYLQYLHEGGIREVDDFFHMDASAGGIIGFEDLKFRRRIEFLMKYFDGRVFVYDQSELVLGQEVELRRIARFIGVPYSPPSMATVVGGNRSVGHWQSCFLRRLNRMDNLLGETLSVHLLNNRITKRFRLNPRGICQVHLGNLAYRPYVLPEEIAGVVKEFFRQDWAYAMKVCQYYD